MKNYILYVCCLLAVMAAGCYPEEFDNKTWGPEPQLELSAPGVTLQPTESSETITVTTNYEEWTAEVAADGREWCSVKQQENQLVIQVKENTGEKERTTVITVTVGNGKKETKEIAVTQLGTAPKIVVTPSALSFEMKGGTQEVTVTANVDTWTPTVSVGSDWCSASKEGDVLKVGATAYAGREMREALITLTGNGNGATAVATLKVVQMGTDPVLTVADAAAFQATGGSQSLLVTTNRDSWTVTVPSTASWCKAEQDGNNLKLTTEANTGTTGRSCEVLVTAGTGEDILMYRLMVAQLGSENELILSTDEVRFEGQASMQTISVFTRGTWEAKTDASWCTLLQGENTLTMYVEQNPSETQIRRGIVTVTAENLPAQQLDIIQLPDITLILSVDTLVMPIEGGQQAVTVVTNQAHLSARNQDSIIWCWTNVSGNQLIVNAEPNEGAPRSIVVNVTAGTGEAIKTVPLVVRQEGLSSDRDILMAFYEATGGDNWTRNDNWGSDRPLSEWYGVTTEMIAPATKAGEPVERVVELNMRGEHGGMTYNGNNLTGTFPAVICGLTELRTLNLYNNELTGELPAELGNLSKLQSLGLLMNDWFGKLPAELGNLKELTYLGISSDYFDEQPLPDWLWTLSKLENMNLKCNFTGTLPAAIGNLTFLEYLDLSNNQLIGAIPITLGNLTKMRYLFLYSNQLTGEIPVTLGNLTQLVNLRLDDNQLTGSIPSELGNLSQVQYLILSENPLTGSIPPELGNLSQLSTLNLSSTQLTGSIPPELGNLSQLRYLYISDTQTTGSIPAEMGALSQLQYLYMNYNQLTGTIPPELGNLSQLKVLSLQNNLLSGSIPPELGNLTLLEELDLVDNQFSGNIPVELGDLVQLQELTLSNNQLTGSIPSALGRLTQLVRLFLENNQLTGSIPRELGNLTLLEYLDLSRNQLTGSVPEELTRLPNWGTTITPEKDIFPQQGGNLEMEQPGDGEGGIHMDLEDKPVTDGETIDVDGTI